MQTVAAFFAQYFMAELKTKMDQTKTIKFLKIKTLMIPGTDEPRFMSCERRFATTDKFVRFTNNTDYGLMEEKAVAMGVSPEFVQLVMAFSHWTYKASERQIMVVDLQGIVSRTGTGEKAVLLTDPAIHCETSLDSDQ